MADCSIIRNNKGEVTQVLAPNGNVSQLYLDALKTNTEQDALDIWAVGSTPLFKDEVLPENIKGNDYIQFSTQEKNPNLDKNGEPNLKTVLAYISSKNTTEELTKEERKEAKVALIGTSYNNAQELAVALKAALLVPTKQSLEKLNFFNKTEISDILNDAVLQANLLESAQKTINTEESLDNNLEVDDKFLTVDINSKTIFGKYKINNPFLTEAKIIQELGGIKDENKFEEALQNSEIEIAKRIKKPNNSQNKATTELVTEYLKAKLGQDISILPESEMLKELQKRGFSSLQGMVESGEIEKIC